MMQVREFIASVGSVPQVSSLLLGESGTGKEVAASLINAAKTRGMTTLLVGHVTKDGSIAGPRLLERLYPYLARSPVE